ncbi:MAG TPA: hypothetical protein VIT67_19045, partial [Povalibacter sp.]
RHTDRLSETNGPNNSFTPKPLASGDWTSSDTLIGLLGTQDTHKRLGDGYHEQRLVGDEDGRHAVHPIDSY